MSSTQVILTLPFLVILVQCGKGKDAVIGRYLVPNLPTENVQCNECQRNAPLVWPVFSHLCIRTSNQHEISIIEETYETILLSPGTTLFCCLFGFTDNLKCDWSIHYNERTIEVDKDSSNTLDFQKILDVMDEEYILLEKNISISYTITSPKMLTAVRLKAAKKFLIKEDYQVSLYVNDRETEAPEIELKVCSELNCRTNVDGKIGNESVKIEIEDKLLSSPINYTTIINIFKINNKFDYKRKLRTSCIASWRLPPKMFSYRKLVSVSKVSELTLIKEKMEFRFRSEKKTYNINDDLYCYVTAYENSKISEEYSQLTVGHLPMKSGRLSGRRLTLSFRLQKSLLSMPTSKYFKVTARCCGVVGCQKNSPIKGSQVSQEKEKRKVVFRLCRILKINLVDPQSCDQEPGTIEISPTNGPFMPGQKLTCKVSNCGTWKYVLILEREGKPHPTIKEFSDSFLIKPELLGGRYNITCTVMSVYKANVWKSDAMTATFYIPVHSVTTDKDKVILEEGDSFKCLAKGYPSPEVKWISVPTDITSASKFRYNFHVNNRSTLTVKKNALIGPTVIMCKAVNKIDNDTYIKLQEFTFYIQYKKEDEGNTWIVFLYMLLIFFMYSCIFLTRRKTRGRRRILYSKKRY